MEPDKEITVIYGDVCLRKQKQKQQKSLIVEKFHEFTDSTTLHGLRYITQRELHPVEKIFWLITFIISVLTCFYLMSNVWMKWTTSPVIVSMSEKLVSVDEIPFPSVTICPQTKNVPSKFDYFEFHKEMLKFHDASKKSNDTYNEKTLSEQEKEIFYDLTLICNMEIGLERRPIVNETAYSDISLINNILKVAPKFGDIFDTCHWRNEYINCSQLFKRLITSEGLCYTMNTLASSEIFRIENLQHDFKYLEEVQTSYNWTREEGYVDGTSEAYPKRGRKNGVAPDLAVTLKIDPKKKDKICNRMHSGFKIFVHHPADLPQTSLYYYSALPSQVSSMALKFEISTSSKNLESISVDKRQCYFPGERTLRYFQSYSPNNCNMECLTNYTFIKCGCVGFYMPYHISSKICKYEQWKCMKNAQEELAHENENGPSLNKHGCNCLPACDSIEYDSEILKSTYDAKDFWKNFISAWGLDDDFSDSIMGIETYSKIEVFYKQPRFMSYKRSELFGKTDFIANCGGLLGLFLGFSFLSLVEILYFITLRIWCALARDSPKK